MKRLFYLFGAAVVCTALVSCERDIAEADSLVAPEVAGAYRLEAVIARDAATRTQLTEEDGALYARWTDGDEIAVVTAGGLETYGLAEGGGLSASFAGDVAPAEVAGTDYRAAVYPAEGAFCRTENGTLLGAAVPAEQNYTPGSFAEEAMPMAALWREGDASVLFKPMAAAVRLSLYADEPTTLRSVTLAAKPLSAATGESVAVAGEVALTLGAELYADYAVPATDYALVDEGGAFLLAPAADGDGEVRVTGPIELSTDGAAPTELCIVVAPALYPKGFTVTLEVDDDTRMVAEAGDPVVNKPTIGGEARAALLPGDILDMPLLKFEAEQPAGPAPLKLKPTFVLDGQNLFYYENAPEFVEGDRMGVILNGENIPADYTVEEGEVYFVTEPVTAPEGTELMCYFPYSEEAVYVTEPDGSDPAVKAGTLRLPLPDEQVLYTVGTTDLSTQIPTASQYALCGDGKGNYTVTAGPVGEAIEVPLCAKESGMVTWKFGVANWQSEELADEMIESLTISTPSGVFFGGEALFNDANGKTTFNYALTEMTVKLANPVKLGYQTNTMLYIVGNNSGRTAYNKGFSVTVRTDKAEYTVYTVEQTESGGSMYTVLNMKPGSNNQLGVNIDVGTPSTARLSGQPFTVGEILYDYMERPADGTIYGWTTMDRESYPWDVLGYEITSIDEGVKALYIYTDRLTNWESLGDAEILESVVTNGTRITEPGIVEVSARQDGPARFDTAVAVVAEYGDGTQRLFRTHLIATQRGNANFKVWE